jgi:tyrosyl-tRNA synthetase
MFGKLMSVSDELMWKYWLLLTDRSVDDIEILRRDVTEGRRHPMEVKKELALLIVEEFHNAAAAQDARKEFDRVFSGRKLPTEIPEVEISTEMPTMLLSKVLVQAGLAASNSEARRLMSQGGVKVDGESASDPKMTISLNSGESLVIQVGKRRIAKVSVVMPGDS